MRNRYWFILILISISCTILYTTPAMADDNVIIFQGRNIKRSWDPRKVELTLIERKPGVYAVTGTFTLERRGLEFTIAGRTYVKLVKETLTVGHLTAEAHYSKNTAGLLVDGDVRVSNDSGMYFIDLVIKHPTTGQIFFEGTLAGLPLDVKPEEKPAPETSRPEIDENKIPAVEGKTPSPPEEKEVWNGHWRGKEHVTYVLKLEGVTPQVREAPFEMDVVQDGSTLRLIGYGEAGKETTLPITTYNPNVAKSVREWRSGYADGSSQNKTTLIVFLSGGRLYMFQRLEMTITAKGIVTHATSDVVGAADRVK